MQDLNLYCQSGGRATRPPPRRKDPRGFKLMKFNLGYRDKPLCQTRKYTSDCVSLPMIKGEII